MKTGTDCTQFSPLRRMRLSREKAGLSPKRKAKEKFFDAGINSLDRTVPRLEASGRLARGKKAGKLKVLNARSTPGFSCAHSTDLYPDQVFGSVNENLSPDILKQISIALLQMPEQASAEGAKSVYL